MSKFIFVTGGVVSSLGKGIAVASIGRMLKSRGLTVSVLKLDPYLNVDPGTMSPYQHGEVFVTVDGSETDLDLGHYERFIDVELTALSNVTAGQIYSEVIAKERAGEYLGGTIQTVPHVTNLIKDRILMLAEKSQADIVVVEVGGTVGDIEGQPFLEAIRQVRNVVGRQDTFYIHVTLLPYLGTTGELKTKPTQHSVHVLRGMGIQPDAILCRADHEVGDDERRKISLYCDVATEAVIGLPTLPSVYEVPLHLEAEGLGDILMRELGLPDSVADLDSWRSIVRVDEEEHPEIDIALVREARKGAGDDVDILVDAGQVWDWKTALVRARQFQEFGIFWLEEPLHPQDVDGYRRLSEESPVPIAAAEAEANFEEFERMVVDGGLDWIQPDPGRCGISTFVEAGKMAVRNRRKVVNHSFKSGVTLSASLQALSAVPGTTVCEFCMADSPLRHELTNEVFDIDDDGFATLPEGPGLGVTINEAIIEKYRVG